MVYHVIELYLIFFVGYHFIIGRMDDVSNYLFLSMVGLCRVETIQ
jgi:hypothetical protein